MEFCPSVFRNVIKLIINSFQSLFNFAKVLPFWKSPWSCASKRSRWSCRQQGEHAIRRTSWPIFRGPRLWRHDKGLPMTSTGQYHVVAKEKHYEQADLKRNTREILREKTAKKCKKVSEFKEANNLKKSVKTRKMYEIEIE